MFFVCLYRYTHILLVKTSNQPRPFRSRNVILCMRKILDRCSTVNTRKLGQCRFHFWYLRVYSL